MYKVLFAVLLFSSNAAAQPFGPDTEPGRLFLVDIDGERVVYQAGFDKIWYPSLADMFGMTLPEQLDFIEQLEYAGIRDWRIGYYWDTTPLKWSIFGHVRHPGGNQANGYDTSVYFPYTSHVIRDGETFFYTHGRTGDEWGDPQSGGSGAIISMGPLVPFGLPDSDEYASRGVPVPEALEEDQPDSVFAPVYPDGRPRTFYTLVPSLAQDHWTCGADDNCTYNEDLNYTPANAPFCLQGDPQVRDCGAWTVTEAMPQFWEANGDVHEIRIASASQPEGQLMPVTMTGVWQDEAADSSSPDVEIIETDEATVVRLPAERDEAGNGRVYHIVFGDGDGEYAFRVGVPNIVDNRHLLIDDGRVFRLGM
ncbi:MAG: hypothetical protein F4053_11730 [Proteobacteria bacterium]|nr:hypothetical protein [Pseudomonadota bacterium]MYJ96218.1 hypothetical protein [Pseudomonadota bacterium]